MATISQLRNHILEFKNLKLANVIINNYSFIKRKKKKKRVFLVGVGGGGLTMAVDPGNA